jgi:sec-independent protein translocase protein TatA
MMGNILTPTHLLLILAVALLVLGPQRLPEAGRGLGSALRGFKDALSMPEGRDEQPMIPSEAEGDRAPDACALDGSGGPDCQETSAP